MTAAHRLPGAILTPRCRGARAVAIFNAAERHGARNQILPDAGTAQAAAIEQLAAFTAKFPQIVAQLGLGKRK